MVNGEPRNFRGTIAYVSGDNLGSQYMGGFKQGSKSHRKCRVCMGNGAEITTNVSIVIVVVCNHVKADLHDPTCCMQFSFRCMELSRKGDIKLTQPIISLTEIDLFCLIIDSPT